MSRLEKNIQEKSKKRKYKYIMRIVFLVIMIISTSVCVFIVDSSAKNMLGIKKYDFPNIDLNIHKIVEQFNR